ncbi:MAG: acyl-CoA dehydrogenase family protein [Gammaproteobacteria bacterium]
MPTYFADEPEHLVMLRELLARFIAEKMPRDKVRAWDRAHHFPVDVFAAFAELGTLGLTFGEEYGGTGRDVVAAIMVVDLLCTRGMAVSGPFIHSTMYAGLNITESGSEAQRREILPKVAAGEMLFAYGLSEPDVGGDLASVTTRAERVGDRVRISGAKRWCTMARDANYIYCLVRSDRAAPRYQNLSLVLVPSSTPGITITDIDHIGLRYTRTCDVVFEDVEVPVENIVGGPDHWNRGWEKLVGPALDVERLAVAAMGMGIMRGAVEDAWAYAGERRQFGRLIADHQAVRHALVDARTRLVACEHMLYHAAWLAQQGRPCAVESSMAKLYICDTAVDVVIRMQQVLGAYGCAEEYDLERHVRDVTCVPIVGGSSNMQRNNIANRLRLSQR